jgi:hypothetical protein
VRLREFKTDGGRAAWSVIGVVYLLGSAFLATTVSSEFRGSFLRAALSAYCAQVFFAIVMLGVVRVPAVQRWVLGKGKGR